MEVTHKDFQNIWNISTNDPKQLKIPKRSQHYHKAVPKCCKHDNITILPWSHKHKQTSRNDSEIIEKDTKFIPKSLHISFQTRATHSRRIACVICFKGTLALSAPPPPVGEHAWRFPKDSSVLRYVSCLLLVFCFQYSCYIYFGYLSSVSDTCLMCRYVASVSDTCLTFWCLSFVSNTFLLFWYLSSVPGICLRFWYLSYVYDTCLLFCLKMVSLRLDSGRPDRQAGGRAARITIKQE